MSEMGSKSWYLACHFFSQELGHGVSTINIIMCIVLSSFRH